MNEKEQQPNRHREVIDEPPPFLGTWKRVHLVIVAYLFVLIVVFYLFGKSYS